MDHPYDDAEETPSRGRSLDLPRGESEASSLSASRVERLLRAREMRRSRSTGLLGDDPTNPFGSHASSLNDMDRGTTVSNGGHPNNRLLVIANRLPVSAVRAPGGGWRLDASAGGLVSALRGIAHIFDTMWIGWPGIYVEEGPEREALTAALLQEGCHPVYLSPEIIDLYYNGYCNNILWPLFHYVPLPMEAKLAETRTLQAQWAAYQMANRSFAAAVVAAYQDGDVIWCHDYHLLLLPAMLKERLPKTKIGWFLHTPFPSSEIYRTLPLREEILRSVLKADLIGFHTYDYARHFVSACTRILGLEGTPQGVEEGGQVTRVAAFPIGIDPERFTDALDTDVVKSLIAELRARFSGRKVMLGVDRLDMIKGIPQKLLAFEKFLDEKPEWRDKVLLIQIAVPSRTDVPEYQRLTSLVHEIVGRINGRFGTLGSVPIHHLDRSLGFHELAALYAVTDVALVTSLRDGMNLVSYEYVACQSKNAGVLVLSEFAGAAQSLGAGAILVNPWNISEMSAAIEEALTMSEAERRERHRQNFMYVTIHTAQAWADTFVSELNDTHIEAELRTSALCIPPEIEVDTLLRSFSRSRRRLLVLGYNATLTLPRPPQRSRERQFDQMSLTKQVHPTVLESLRVLAADPSNTIVVFSGSERSRLEEHFNGLPVWLAAENGVFIRPPPKPGAAVSARNHGQPEWKATMDTSSMDWLESVQLVFDYFCERTPRSFVEARETSLVWNYKYADPEFGRLQARDMLQHLWTGPISNAAVDVLQGAKSVEVRPVGVSKGAAMERIVAAISEEMGAETRPVDFVLCCGHFLMRDEDIFSFFDDKVQLAARRSASGPSDGSGPAGPSGRADAGGSSSRRSSRDASADGEGGEGGGERGKRSGASGSTRRRQHGSRGQGSHENSGPIDLLGDPAGMGASGGASGASAGVSKGVLAKVFALHTLNAYTCTVGKKCSSAKYFVPGAAEVADVLQAMARSGERAPALPPIGEAVPGSPGGAVTPPPPRNEPTYEP